MAVDRAALRVAADQLADHIAEGYEDAELGPALIMAEVRWQDEEGATHTGIAHWCQDERKWVHLGMLRAAALNVEAEHFEG